MRLIAHRSRVGGDPENAISSLRPALAMVSGVEVDVRVSADAVPILMHDPTVERTTDGEGAVADLPARQLRTLTLSDGHPIPTLAGFLNVALSERTPLVLLDVKARSRSALEAIVRVATHYPREGIIMAARSPRTLDRLRTLSPTARLACLGVTTENVQARIAAANDTGTELLFIRHGDNGYRHHRAAVRTIQEHGLTPAASTLASRRSLDLAAKDGCSIALVDLPPLEARDGASR